MNAAKVLIVEDDAYIAEGIKKKIEKYKYTVCSMATSGKEAIKKAQEMLPDIILMDIILEGKMDGIEASNRISALLDIPIIYLTAYSDEKTLNRARKTEPAAYVMKPASEKELHSAIEIALYKHSMEKKVKESHKWFSTTLTSIGEGIVCTDKYGFISFINPAAEKITGWSKKETINKNAETAFPFMYKTSKKKNIHPITQVIKKSAAFKLPNDTLLIKKNGIIIPVTVYAAPIKDERNIIIGAVLSFQDISEQKKQESELRKHQEHLEELVEEKVKELKENQAQLLQTSKLATLGEMAAGLAHEINQPLSAISLIVQTYRKLQSKCLLTENEIESGLLGIETAVNRMSKIITHIRTFAKQESNPQFVSFNLHEIIENTLDMLGEQLRIDGIRIEKQFCEGHPQIVGEPFQMEQVLINLFINARDALNEKERKKSKGYNKKLIIKTTKLKNGICIRVIDNGCGMCQNTIERVFHPFFTTKEVGKGIGLGMSISHGIIKSFDGKIEVESEQGEHTAINILLPDSLSKCLDNGNSSAEKSTVH